MKSWTDLLIVFLGGGSGAVCRYLLTGIIGARLGTGFPYGTMAVNTAGSFLIGLITFYFAYGHNIAVPEPLRLLAVVGFLGGFTTFSSFALESLTLAQNQSVGTAAANVAGNVVFTLLAVAAGMLTARSFS